MFAGTGNSFTHTTLGRTGIRVCRLGLTASYWPGRKTVEDAIERGINLFFAYGFDRQMIKTLREAFKGRRDRLVLMTGAYNFVWAQQNLRKALEKRLRQFNTDYIDVLMFLGVMKPEQFPESILEEMIRLRDQGKARAIGISTHDRTFAGKLASEGNLDLLMIRYNAAHRGAEADIFPFLQEHDPGLVSYTATRWRYLLRRAKGWPEDRAIPDACMAYRFVLSNPHVDACLTAPSNFGQFERNFKALEQGPLTVEEDAFMREFGDAVYRMKKWFM